MTTSHGSARKRSSVLPSPAVPAGGTEFDGFLYAYIGEDSHGMPLSVLSALARRNVDPWDEASRLARLPRSGAIQFLTTLIAALPEDSLARSNPEMHAERLAALLPHGVASSSQAKPAAVAAVTTPQQGLVRYALIYLLLMALFFGVQWLMEHSH